MRQLYTLLILAILFTASPAFSQCVPGEVEVEFVMSTDDYGYEIYWELLPSGNECGDGTIASGGNDIDVGCDGVDQEDADAANGYASNITFTEGPFCLTEDEFYDIIFVDDYADGGLSVAVYQAGVLTHSFGGDGGPSVWTFQIGESEIPENNVPCGAGSIDVDGNSLLLDNTTAAAADENEPAPIGASCQVFGVWCEGNLSNTVWTTFIAPDDGAVVISTCNEGTEFDTQLALYKADDCGNYETFEFISSNDDQIAGCGAGNQYASTMYASCLVPGDTYYIQMDGWQGETGIAELTVNSYDQGIDLQAQVGNVACPNVKGETTGFIALQAIGTGVDYTATWSGPNDFVGEGIFNGELQAGDYEIEIVTSCGTMASATFTVGIPDSFSVDASIANATCEGSTDGAIAVVVEGGTAPYSLFWTGPDDFQSDESNLSDLLPGVYNLSVTDDNGCEYNQNVSVDFDNDFSFDLGADQTICEDEELFLTGPAGYTYEWQDGSDNQFFTASGVELGLGTTPIVLTVSDGEGCEYTDALFLTVEDCTSINELSRAKLKIFPNPSGGDLYISGLQSVVNYSIDVIDATGKRVTSLQMNTQKGLVFMDVSGLASGLYIARITAGDSHRNLRFTVK